MRKKIVIVGGVAGGASAAARLRRLDENCEIILLEKGPYVSFANCGLPYYAGDIIDDREMLFVQTPEKMKKRFAIDIRTRHEVLKVIPEERKVLIKDHQTHEQYEEMYDYLLLSPGSKPIQPPISGLSEVKNIFTLWTVPDVDQIKEYIDRHNPKKAVVIGGGFIGLEMAENLHHLGLDITIVEMADQVMAPLDPEMAMLVHHHLFSKNINLHLNNGVRAFEFIDDQTTQLHLQDGQNLTVDLIILCAGVKPNTSFLKDSGLLLNKRGGIIVNEFMETSIKNIYAVGDAVEITDFITKTPAMIPLAGPANKQGRIAANNIMGRMESYKGTQGTSIVKIFELSVATTGANEKTLKRLNIPYITSLIEANSHATYYPGATSMFIKLLFTPSGKLLGAQIIGGEGVDKRIDVIATTLRQGATVADLEELELAYAPPYSSAKDPVNIAGYVANNIYKGDFKTASYDEIKSFNSKECLILDVREEQEREEGYIPNSLHIPLSILRENMEQLPKDKKIIIYCRSGSRSYLACRILSQNGFVNVKNLMGGYVFYKILSEGQKQDL
ncbi:MAG: FAD-dependent oxidoreductase [Epulopiscium sp.]|nr:FAD-dependent oxidoreductase [Candidatus Epulonipiscium sp.]